jgi:DNA-binding IclR family transcriptional regulator
LSESIRAVERALDVLQCFSRETPELSMTSISEQIGIHKSTVHRLLATLERRRYVQRDPTTGMYKLGIRLLQMAYLTLEHIDLRRLSTPYLRYLSERQQETVHLTILDGADVVFVNIIESQQRVKLAAALGQRLPAFATASGKAILAYLPEDEVRFVLSRGMPRFTEFTPGSPEAYFENLYTVREEGFAISVQELENDINAVAAPIFDMNDQPVASIAIAGPAYRLTPENMVELGPLVKATAGDISQELRYSLQPSDEASHPVNELDADSELMD